MPTLYEDLVAANQEIPKWHHHRGQCNRSTTMSCGMNLSTTETFEVWFLPDNRISYSPRLIAEADSLQEATEFAAKRLPVMAGKLEVARVTTARQLVTHLSN